MNQLRPNTLSDVIGQKEVVEVLNISIKSAKSRNTIVYLIHYSTVLPALVKQPLPMQLLMKWDVLFK